MDLNKNNLLSFAELDKGVRDVIKIPQLFELKPVLHQAFNTAKNLLKGSSTHDKDFVSKDEFKYLLIYLRQYYDYWTVFNAIDTSKDHRVTSVEFQAAVPILEKYGVDMKDP